MKKTGRKVKTLKIEKLIYALIIFVAVLIPIANVFSKAVLSETNIEVEKLENKISKQTNINDSLDMQINELASLSSVQDIAKEYMGGSWLLGGGKTGMARRLSLDEPSLTLTCSPCQKQTERCHPLETRPLTVREYARIQTFPDYWQFQGTMTEKYKQIGNAVPVNLAWAVGRSLIRLFNDIQTIFPSETEDCRDAVQEIIREQSKLVVVKDKATQTSTILQTYKQLNFLDIFDQYADAPIVENTMVQEDMVEYGNGGHVYIDHTKNCFVGLVKKDNMEQYIDKSAKIYYTGKKFPATVALNKLYYFMPYLKGKGIRDLYLIKIARVGTRNEGQESEDKTDFRLVFEIEFVKQLFDDYKLVELKIWHTFTDTTIKEIAMM